MLKIKGDSINERTLCGEHIHWAILFYVDVLDVVKPEGKRAESITIDEDAIMPFSVKEEIVKSIDQELKLAIGSSYEITRDDPAFEDFYTYDNIAKEIYNNPGFYFSVLNDTVNPLWPKEIYNIGGNTMNEYEIEKAIRDGGYTEYQRNIIKCFLLRNGLLSNTKLEEVRNIRRDLRPSPKKVIYNGPATIVIFEDGSKTVVKLQEGERVRVVEAEIIDSKTKPKARYTTASLLDFMKLNNIGTGATRDKIIKELTEKKGMNKESAVIKDGKYFVSTEFGRKMDGVIPDEIKSIDYVKNLEKRINAIAEGKDSLESFISDMQADFNSMLKELKGNRSSKLVQHYPNEKLNTDMICPCCGKAIANVGWGYSCTGWKKDGSGCNFAIGNKQYGKTISEKIVKQLINNKKSSVALKGLKKKNGETFKSAAYLTLDIMSDGRAKVGFTFE